MPLKKVINLECYNRKMMPDKHHTRLTPVFQILSAIGIGFGAFLAVFLLINLAISLIYSGRIMPGVTMNGIPLAGLTVDQAAQKISLAYRYPDSGTILLVDEERSWSVRPVQLGFYLDPVASAKAAYETGRKGTLKQVLSQRFNLFNHDVMAQPSFIFDQKAALNYLNALATQINQPLHEAAISIYGTQVVVQNGQSGRLLDVGATLVAVTLQVQSMQDGVVPLVILQNDPVILSADAEAELARGVLSQALVLTFPADASEGGNSIQIDPSSLAPLLVFEKVQGQTGSQYQIAVSRTLMTAYLESFREKIEASPENARFTFNDDTQLLELLKPAVIGRTLDVEGSIRAIDQALQKGEHSAVLSFVFNDPAVTDTMTGAQLGITELVREEFTYFAGSSAERVQNITKAAAEFHGLLIAPGETLSMAEVLGDISLDNGYAEALIIIGDETIKGVGGGVCQVSTTLFRTALYAGYPILERHPHAYRVGYYEQVNSTGAHDATRLGFDAAVFVPLVDFKFKNDTPNWLLMETYVRPDKNYLWWKFYSTSDGRSVDISSTGPGNIVPALETVYRENPELAAGEKKHVDYAVEGADVTVTRIVTRNGETLYSDKFFTRYEPWGDVYEYGPGTEGIPTPTPSP